MGLFAILVFLENTQARRLSRRGLMSAESWVLVDDINDIYKDYTSGTEPLDERQMKLCKKLFYLYDKDGNYSLEFYNELEPLVREVFGIELPTYVAKEKLKLDVLKQPRLWSDGYFDVMDLNKL